MSLNSDLYFWLPQDNDKPEEDLTNKLNQRMQQASLLSNLPQINPQIQSQVNPSPNPYGGVLFGQLGGY